MAPNFVRWWRRALDGSTPLAPDRSALRLLAIYKEGELNELTSRLLRQQGDTDAPCISVLGRCDTADSCRGGHLRASCDCLRRVYSFYSVNTRVFPDSGYKLKNFRLSHSIFGITCVQTYLYFKSYPKDSLRLKFTVRPITSSRLRLLCIDVLAGDCAIVSRKNLYESSI